MSTSPFADFGTKLKKIREQAKESIADVSGAVEMDAQALAAIEAGENQPSEDIVLLLISHFALKEDEALKMWQLAGYDQDKTGVNNTLIDNTGNAQSNTVITAGPILYTDIVNVNANHYGVVINFMQSGGANNQPLSISRIGMSHIHAKSLLSVLQQTLQLSAEQEEPKK